MKIFILTFGTRGDVHLPYIALGKGLRANGHQVMVCICGRFKLFIDEHGLKTAFPPLCK